MALLEATADRKRGRTLGVEEAHARFMELTEPLAHCIADIGRAFSQRGASKGWMAAAFDRSDERAMQLCRRLELNWKGPLPEQKAVLLECAVERLEEEASVLGYKHSRGQWGEHLPGCVQVAVFTLGIIVVQNVRTVDVINPGIA